MQEQKNKKMFLLIILLSILIILIGIIAVFVWKSMYSKRNERNIGEQTNIDVVKEIFPGLEGIDKVCWEVNDFSDGFGAPGPTELQFKGKIVLEEEIANKYKEDYEWKEVNVNIEADTFDVSKYNQRRWYYNFKFQQQIVSKRVMGKIYFSGEELWFNIVYN